MTIVSGRDKIPVWSVSDLSSAISGTLVKTFGYIAVRGEVSNFSRSQNGHIYFAIKDENHIIKAVCFVGIARSLEVNLADGMEIIAYGQIDCWAGQSQYQLKVQSVKLAGIGAMMAILEERKKKLMTEGLFNQEHKRPIPEFPKKVGILTSESGAVIHDIITKLEDRMPVELLVYNIQVQGDLSAKQAIDGLRYFNKTQDVDIIIIARGGGSFEDLFTFNDEDLVREIFASRIPVISAIGHEVDYTLCDFVADVRAPTPTAATDCVGMKKSDFLAKISYISNNITVNLNKNLETSTYFLSIIVNKCNNIIVRIDNIDLKFIENINKIHQLREKVIIKLNFMQEKVTFLAKSMNIALQRELYSKRNVILFTSQMLYKTMNGAIETRYQKVIGINISPDLIQRSIKRKIGDIVNNIDTSMYFIIKKYENNLENVSLTRNADCIIQNIDILNDKVRNSFSKINNLVLHKIENISNQIRIITNTIATLDNATILSRGYAIIRDIRGKIIMRTSDLENKMTVLIQMQDGSVYASIKFTKEQQIILLGIVVLGFIFINFIF